MPQENSSRQRSFAKFAQSPTWEEYRVRIDFDNLGQGCQRHSYHSWISSINRNPMESQHHSMHQGEKVRFRPSRVFCSDPLQPPVHEIGGKTRYRQIPGTHLMNSVDVRKISTFIIFHLYSAHFYFQKTIFPAHSNPKRSKRWSVVSKQCCIENYCSYCIFKLQRISNSAF